MTDVNLDFTVSNVVTAAFKIFVRNFFTIMLTALIVFAPLLLYTIYATRGIDPGQSIRPERFIFLMLKHTGTFYGLSMVCNQILSAATIYSVVKELHGEQVSRVEALGHAMRRLVPALLVGLIWTLTISFGMLLLIIPGFIFMCRYYVAVSASVMERPGVFGAMSRSAQLTQGNKMNIFGIIFLSSAVTGFVTNIIQRVMFGLDGIPDDGHQFRQLLWMQLTTSVLAGAFSAVLVAVTYASLRYTREGASVDELARVFD